jgi:hypothetical protein
MSDFATAVREEARLIILRQLAGEVDGVLNSSLIQAGLASWGINKPREWVHAEIQHLETVGAVKAAPNGTVLIVEVLSRGVDHVERRLVLPGVKRPSPAGA